MTKPDSSPPIEGFTLLELLVAFLILSTAMAVALQTISIASRSVTVANEKHAVVQLVDELRTEILQSNIAKQKLFDEGQHNGMRWEIELSSVLKPSLPDHFAGLAIIKIYPVEGARRHHDFIVFASGKMQ